MRYISVRSAALVCLARDQRCREDHMYGRCFLTAGSDQHVCLCLFCAQSVVVVAVLWRYTHVANLPAEAVIAKLNAAVERNNPILTAARHARQQRTEAQILREQQDIEYQESLAADRRREQEVRERAEREELERLQKEEEERVAEANARRAEDDRLRQEQEYQADIEAKRARIADGPKSRTPPPGADYKTAVIKFHLHNGTRLDHIFYAHDTLQTARDFIDVEFYDRGISIRNYELATNFPKRVYGPELLDVTLAESVRVVCRLACCIGVMCCVVRGYRFDDTDMDAFVCGCWKQGLAPQALVFVQDLDS